MKEQSALRYIKTAITIFGAISLSVGVYALYRNYVWQPKVELVGVDYVKGVAQLTINGREVTLLVNSRLAAGDKWSVAFNSSDNAQPDRIEVLKEGLLKYILHKK